MEPTNADFLTVEDAAQLVGLSHWTLRCWLRLGRLTKYRSGRRRTMISRVELLELLKPVKVRPASSVRRGAAIPPAAPFLPKGKP